MVDPTEHELAAMEAASDMAGEYLDSLGKTDLATMDREEWMVLIQCVVSTYGDRLRELKDEDIPF